jgi:hypothetical protein
MEILRVPPYPITTTWNLPDNNYDYIVYVEDLVDHSIEESTITSSSTGIVTYTLPAGKVQFDRQFLIRFYDNEHEHIIYESNLDVIRPYVNPATLGTTASEIADYKKWELIARSIIDTYTSIGFYNHKSILQTRGSNTDYLPVWRDANRVLRVYENNKLIYNLEDSAISITDYESDDSTTAITTASPNGYAFDDIVTLSGFTNSSYNKNYRVLEVVNPTTFKVQLLPDLELDGSETAKRFWESEFKVTLDNSAIYRVESDVAARLSSNTIKLPASRGDIATGSYNYGTFPEKYDYLFVLDEGFRAIPPDIERAATMLIDDLKCGRLDYYQKYVTSYNTDQFRIQFDKKMLEGTGNLLVDKILDKYMKSITKVGVL